jgi:cell division inhibitor SepF
VASAMRKMAVYLGLVEDDRYDDYDVYEHGAAATSPFPDRRGPPAYPDRHGSPRVGTGAAGARCV